MLKGKRTHIIAYLMIVVGFLQIQNGDITLQEFVNTDSCRLILEGLGLSFLRIGVASNNKE